MKKVIELRNVSKQFDGETVLDSINLDIYDNEFLTLLGPSGCGKTTTLRMIGGFETPDQGDILFLGERINDIPPHKRNINTVFQRYALFPHLNVFENVAFPLREQKLPRGEIEQKVNEMLALVKLTGFERRNVTRLSGGQQQRVAIARALVSRPRVLLLDEPLAALDLKLRKDMQIELKRIQQTTGITFIYVTHDQVEAMTLADRIVVMREGEIQQIASPNEIYNNPINQFVAGFIGSPSMNFLPVRSGVENGNYFLQAGESRLLISDLLTKRIKDQSGLGKELVLGIRPEDLHLQKEEKTSADRIEKEKLGRGQNRGTLQMKVMVREGLGAEVLLHGEIEGENACVKLDPSCETRPGEMISLYPDMTKIKLFDAQTGDNLLYMNLKNEKR